jgi:hypothetical protein
VEPPFISKPSTVQVLAEEPGAAGTQSTPQRTPDEEIPVIPLKPLDDEAPTRPAAASWRDSQEPPSVSARPSPQVRTGDRVAPPAGDTGKTSTPDDRSPIIRLRPLDDEAPMPAARGPRTAEDDGDELVGDTLRRDRPEGTLLRVLSAFGALLSRCLDPITRLERGLPLISPDEPAPWRAAGSSRSTPREPAVSVGVPLEVRVLAEEPTGPCGGYTERRSTADDGLPIIPLKPLEGGEAPPRTATTRRKLYRWASGWIDRLTARVGRLARQDRPRPTVPPEEPAAPRAAGPAPREPLKPPPPTSELPVLRFADVDESRDAEDVYEAEEGESLFHAAWLWTKRIVVMTGLVTGGVLAALTWEAWFPKAAQLGQMLFTEIDRQVRSRDQAERQQRALLEATQQLPHLAPETIQLVLSSSPSGVLDPPEVFQRAFAAADRGLSALTSKEAEELRALRRELLDTLSPAERERVREYDVARARRVTFTFEDRAALEPFARGARALPARSRERVQALLGKAIGAGIVLPTGVTPPDTAGR